MFEKNLPLRPLGAEEGEVRPKEGGTEMRQRRQQQQRSGDDSLEPGSKGTINLKGKRSKGHLRSQRRPRQQHDSIRIGGAWREDPDAEYVIFSNNNDGAAVALSQDDENARIQQQQQQQQQQQGKQEALIDKATANSAWGEVEAAMHEAAAVPLP
uniref:Uncharacterized protein n=1 Tax=Pseudictyota dubia TaxID=2749911 RepID=A0A7R9W4B8_9STRA|mmetsp:Transcript_33330/g.61439  ORF Transcript_33330/g.61439 Transcript_33330/m.61439 type:complete len:155 (+) Transcript_33330:790-1254(+)